MAHITADLIQETSSSTNGASLTLAGSTTGYRAFSAAMANGDTCWAMATNGAGLWQAALYTWNTGGSLTTSAGNVVAGSSGAGAIVTFTGTVTISLAPLASQLDKFTFADGLTAAGTNQGTATAITTPVVSFGTVAAGTGAILPPAKIGSFITVGNHGANSLLLYPASGETVEGGATNAPATILRGQVYRAACAVNGAWVGVDVNVWDDEEKSFDFPAVVNNPTTPDANCLKMYARNISGRVMPKWMPPSGVDTFIQPALFGNNIVMYMPNTGTTAGLNLGTPWAVGTTISHPTPATTAPAIVNQMKRTRSANVVTTTNQVLGVSSIVTGAHQFWRGNAAGLGGFFFFSRFIIELWPAATVRLFVGLQSGTTNVVASDTFPAISMCGLTHVTTEAASVLNFTTKDGTTASSVPITLTGNLAAGQAFDFYMFMKPNDSTIYYRLDDINAGTTLVDSSKTTNLPATTTFMGPCCSMSNGTANTTVTTTAIGVNRIYVESDR